MMDIVTIIGAIAGACVIWHIVTILMIYDSLHRRGHKVSFLLLRAMAPRYAFQYKEVSKAETGRVGSLFYQYLISINSAFALTLVAVALYYL